MKYVLHLVTCTIVCSDRIYFCYYRKLLREMSKKRKLYSDLDGLNDQNSVVEMSELCSAVERISITNNTNLDFENAVGVAVLKFGLKFVENLLLLLRVIPEESGPWRREVASSLLTMLDGKPLDSEKTRILNIALESSQFKKDTGGQKIESYYIQTLSTAIKNTDDEQSSATSQACKWGLQPFAGCIAPPTKHCFVCSGQLTKHNKPCRVTYYLASGPLPFIKVELRCRSCKLNYAISKWGNSSEGYEYYGTLNDVVEASDVVYIDRYVMDMYISLK